MRIVFEMPIRASHNQNARTHWTKRHRTRKAERNATALLFPKHLITPAVQVVLTRIAPREMDDDNLPGALKGIRDEVAQVLRVDDATKLIEWRYEQQKGGPKQYGVQVEVMDIQGVTARGLLKGLREKLGLKWNEPIPRAARAHLVEVCTGCDDPTCRHCGGSIR